MNFDLEAALKDAALFGIGIGIIAMALFLVWAFMEYMAAPKITVAAAVPKPPFGFQLPD
jgi:hypothetical protein